jgi:hypothetical protein
MLPKWSPSSSPSRRGRGPQLWTPTVQVGTWRVSQTQLLAVIALCLLTMLSLATMVGRSSEFVSGWRNAMRRRDGTPVEERREAVSEAMQFVWDNYHRRALGADEIRPINGVPWNSWGGVGCMVLDSMDTLWIMDLETEFEQARQWVHDELRFVDMGEISVFETIIRSVGGLLSAYDLSKDTVFLTKAVELTELLLPAINATTGRADYRLDTATNRSRQAGSLAESGTYQLEFEYLSHATGDPKYRTIAQNFYKYMRAQDKLQLQGLFGNNIAAFDHGHEYRVLVMTMGGGGDSFYEYLLKVWLFTGQREDALTKQMYLDAMDGLRDLLLLESSTGQLFLGDFSVPRFAPRAEMHHLACFVPGMLALGSKRLQGDDARSEKHLRTAKRLMQTCYQEFYEKQPSGLAPESLVGMDLDVSPYAEYKLRPEVVESLYVLYQITGDPMYQDWGWKIFSSIQRHCRTEYGFAEYRDVTRVVDLDAMADDVERASWSVRLLGNRQETFFSAETLKYLYLLFDPTNKHVSLETHVFNTEAHPLSIPK